MALANRIEALREEVKDFIEESRRLQVAALERAMGPARVGSETSAIAAAFFATSAALAMHREAAIGIDSGHEQVRAVIDRFIAAIDPEG